MNWQQKIIDAHTAVTNSVSHYAKMKSSRYFVWQEDGENTLISDNADRTRAITGTTDLFTKKENDPWIEAFEQSMSNYGIAYYLNSVQYEEDTGFIHYEWVWEVI